MDCSCYIVWDPTSGCLKIMGDDKELVSNALVRVQGAFMQVAARQLREQHMLLFKLPSKNGIPLNTRLTDSYSPKLLRDVSNPTKKFVTVVADIECGGNISASPIYRDLRERSKLNAVKEKEVLFDLLNELRYYKGSIMMQFHLGTFLVQQYHKFPDSGWSLKDLETKLKEKGRAMATRE